MFQGGARVIVACWLASWELRPLLWANYVWRQVISLLAATISYGILLNLLKWIIIIIFYFLPFLDTHVYYRFFIRYLSLYVYTYISLLGIKFLIIVIMNIMELFIQIYIFLFWLLFLLLIIIYKFLFRISKNNIIIIIFTMLWLC